MTITRNEIEPLYRQVAKELKSRQISKETIDNALTYIGKVLPAISDYDISVQLAILGIACYNAGVKNEQQKRNAERKELRDRIETDPAEPYRQSAIYAVQNTGSVAAAKAQRDICHTILRLWREGKYQDEPEK